MNSQVDIAKAKDIFIKLTEEYNLEPTEFAVFLNNVRLCKDRLDVENVETFTYEAFRAVVTHWKHSLMDVHYKTVSDCEFIDCNTEGYNNVPYWSFGCHPSGKCEYLLGYLRTSHELGHLMLSDRNCRMLCVVKRCNGDVSAFVNKFVIVKNYVVFTELFRDYSYGISYILCDIADIITVNSNVKPQMQDFGQIRDESFKFLLLKKSTIMLTSDNRSCFWIEVKPQDELKEPFYLCLNYNLLHLHPLLRIGCVYHLHYKGRLIPTSNIELHRLSPDSSLYELKGEASLESLSEALEETAPTVTETIANLKTDTLLSFQGIVATKMFDKPLPSRTQRKIDNPHFGTPGSKTHILKFAGDNGELLTLYLNNWENLQVPFGLLPGMRLLVRNVLTQKEKYCKSTALTSFEVVGYEPKIPFTTANLCTRSGSDWGNPFHLGHGHFIPDAVLVYSRVTTVKFRSLRLSCNCRDCGKPVEKGAACYGCFCKESTLQTTMTLVVEDFGGKSMLICKSLEVLRVLLEIPESQWDKFCEGLKAVGSYRYDKLENFETADVTSVLNVYLNVLNEVGLSDVEMLCRKMESNFNDNDRLPLWLCVQARKKET